MKTVLITGATSGFGYATALVLAKQGYQIIATGRREERLKELQSEIRGLGQHCEIYPLDVRNHDQVQTTIEKILTHYQSIDVLINNAGLALGLNPAQSCNLKQWEQMVDTNIKGLLYITHAILPSMIANNRGQIINLGSVAGQYPYPGGNVYGATKAFVRQFSLNLRADLLGTPIRVTDIAPGMAHTEFSLVRFNHDKNQADAVYQGVQALTANDIAQCIAWVCELPPHINVNFLEVMPTQQAFSPFAVHRTT